MKVRGIVDPERYYNSYIKLWHRETFGVAATAIDIDLLGYCQRCATSLYLIEATNNADKSTRVLTALAKRANVPSIMVRHNDDMIIRATWQTPAVKPIGGEEELKDALTDLRLRHICKGG